MIATPEILEEIKRTQDERRNNWPTPEGPEDADLERVHLAKLNTLKNQLTHPQES